MKHVTTDDQQELFIVVDKKDQIVGYRTRYDCHHDKSLTHRAVGVIIFDEHGRILLQKRSLTKDLQPGLWAISSAGHVGKGEMYEDAARRELLEELGVELPLVYINTWFFVDKRETEMDALFRAISSGPFRPDPTEVDRVEFFSKEELQEKIKTGDVALSTWAETSLKHISFLP